MLFTESGLGGDWEHHLWFVWHQTGDINASWSLSPFLNTTYSVFYPFFQFYGGTMYVLTGALAVVAGSSIVAYVATYLFGFIAAYYGWWWAARLAGVGRWGAHVPAILFVTSASYLTMIYGRGDWLEFLAISMIPLMVASASCVYRSTRIPLVAAATLAVSTVIFFGTHNLTMLWGSTILVLTGVLVVAVTPSVRRSISLGGLLRVAAIMIPAVLVDAWFLVPSLAYQSNTKIGSEYGAANETLSETIHIVSLQNLFTFSRATLLPTVKGFVLALPTLAVAWVLVSLAIVLVTRQRGPWVRVLLVFSAITVAVTVLMTNLQLLLALPKPYPLVEFSYRLEGFVLLGLCATVLAVLAIFQKGRGRLRLYRLALIPILAVSVVGAVQQVDAYPHENEPRTGAYTPAAEIYAEYYDDYGYAPLTPTNPIGLPTLKLSPSKIKGSKVSVSVQAREGQLIDTNIGGGPDLLRITGARVVGHDSEFHLVLAAGAAGASRSPTTPLGVDHITIAPADPFPVKFGLLLSLAGALVLALGFGWLVVQRGRERRGGRASPPPRRPEMAVSP